MKREQNVLFRCNRNSARSQMAGALVGAMDVSRLSVQSAGLYPRPLSEGAIRAMNGIGIDIRGRRSKSTKEFLGRQVVHHAIFLRSESAAFRGVRDLIDKKICGWVPTAMKNLK